MRPMTTARSARSAKTPIAKGIQRISAKSACAIGFMPM